MRTQEGRDGGKSDRAARRTDATPSANATFLTNVDFDAFNFRDVTEVSRDRQRSPFVVLKRPSNERQTTVK